LCSRAEGRERQWSLDSCSTLYTLYLAIRTLITRDKDGNVVEGDEYQQAQIVFAKIRSLVEAAGGIMADVVKVTIFVTDIKQRQKIWKARREVFTGDFPVSTLVQVAALAEPTVKVEIDAIAHIGASTRLT
jgi:enamine deaminase RidA (YjgF/YER057c/UK114 family)